jgi:OmpR-family two-component system manganese-sensing response regulator
MAKILLIEDDLSLAEELQSALQREQHQVEIANTGGDGLQLVCQFGYDLLVLDWHLPDLDGPAILSQARAKGVACPVLFLTGQDRPESKVLALDSGADDYLTKPFSTLELTARIRALLRRSPAMPSDILDFGDIKIDRKRIVVTKQGAPVDLQPKEYVLLEFLARHPGQVFNSEALVNHIWKSDNDATDTAIRVHLSRLRKKLHIPGKPSLISNLYGIGYKFEDGKSKQ